MTITIIAAMAKNRVIGKDGKIPWNNKGDMKHFKEATMGKTCIMGRLTYESIGKPLEGRRTIVVTSTHIEGVETATTLSEALEAASGTDVMICGGARLYEEARTLADDMLLTMIMPIKHVGAELVVEEIEGDTFFPFHPIKEFPHYAWHIPEFRKTPKNVLVCGIRTTQFFRLSRNEFEGSSLHK